MADGNFDILTVSGTSDLGGDVQVGGNLAVGNPGAGLVRTLSVTGVINGGALRISGASTLQGALHVQSALRIDGVSTFAGNVGITGTLNVNGRDVAADGAKLDQHVGRTDNPHGTTAAQVGALAVAGGTVAGPLQVNGPLHAREIHFPDHSTQTSAVRIQAGLHDFGRFEGVQTLRESVALTGFTAPPTVLVSISALDAETGARNLRISAWAEAITPDSFVIAVQTWSNTIIYWARLSWLAFTA